MLHLGLIWYYSEPSDVPYSQNNARPISWFGLFLQQNDSSMHIFFNVTSSRDEAIVSNMGRGTERQSLSRKSGIQ